MGEVAVGKIVDFTMEGVAPQVILTDFLVDKIYPVKAADNVETVARVEDQVVGTHRKYGSGDVWYFGFRPRDDQSASLGYESRTLYEILVAAGAYPPSGKFAGNDNPVVVSRTSDCFASKFPNGTTAIVKHYRTHRENWEGGFSRNAEEDAKALATNPLPSDELHLEGMRVNGHEVTYCGKRNVAFNTDSSGRLCAFNGLESSSITLDGVEYRLADRPVSLCFGGHFAKNGYDCRLFVDRPCKLTIPLPARSRKVSVMDGKKALKGVSFEDGTLSMEVDPSLAGKWLNVSVVY